MPKSIKLAVTLALFCIISAAALAGIYMFTQPKINANARVALEIAQKEVLAGAAGKAFLVSPYGYAGNIDMLVGVGADGKIKGIKILRQRETPGLGAGIARQKFLKQFTGKSARDPLEPKKDIDAITGATISSRAVCAGAKKALEKR